MKPLSEATNVLAVKILGEGEQRGTLNPLPPLRRVFENESRCTSAQKRSPLLLFLW